MPQIKETDRAYIISPTFGEQIASVLPGIGQSFAQAIRLRDERRRERKKTRMALRLEFDKLLPEEQRIALNQELLQELTGKKNPSAAEREALMRGRTPDEFRARRIEAQEEKRNELLIEKDQLNIDELKNQAVISRRRLESFNNVVGDIPPDQLTLLDFVLGEVGENITEASQLFVSQKWPEWADEIAQMNAGAGPIADQVRSLDALDVYEQRYGEIDAKGLAYATAIGNRDFDAISKLADPGLQTLAFKELTLAIDNAAAVKARAEQAKREAIGIATQRVLEQDPLTPILVAQEIASNLINNIPLTPEQAQYNIDAVVARNVAAEWEAQKLQYDTLMDVSGIAELRTQVELDMRIVAAEKGLPFRTKEQALQNIEKLFPELVERLARQTGMPPPNWEEEPPGFWQTGINITRNTVIATLGLVKETGGLPSRPSAPALIEQAIHTMVIDTPQGRQAQQELRERVSGMRENLPEAEFVIQSIQETGRLVGTFFKGALAAVDVIRTSLLNASEMQDQWKARGRLGPPPDAAETLEVSEGEFPALTPDQITSLENHVIEVNKELLNPNLSMSVKLRLREQLNFVEEINNGERPYLDLVSNAQ
jgi:hypothetical protein